MEKGKIFHQFHDMGAQRRSHFDNLCGGKVWDKLASIREQRGIDFLVQGFTSKISELRKGFKALKPTA